MMNTVSYSHGVSTTPLRGETISQNLRSTVNKFGEREALVMVTQNYRATYIELWEQLKQVAKGLLAYSIKKGDRAGISLSEEIREYCKGKIATFKIPKYWKFVDEFPMTVTGKIRKIEMRESRLRSWGCSGRQQV